MTWLFWTVWLLIPAADLAVSACKLIHPILAIETYSQHDMFHALCTLTPVVAGCSQTHTMNGVVTPFRIRSCKRAATMTVQAESKALPETGRTEWNLFDDYQATVIVTAAPTCMHQEDAEKSKAVRLPHGTY